MPFLEGRTSGALFSVPLLLLVGSGEALSADEKSLTIRAYDRRHGTPISNLAAEDVRVFDGRRELTVKALDRSYAPLDIWILVNKSPIVRAAIGEPSAFANAVFAGLRGGDQLHFDHVCAEQNLDDGPLTPSTLTIKIDPVFAGSLKKKEPVVDCLLRFAQRFDGKPPEGRWRHLVMLADDSQSYSTAKTAAAERVGRIGATISIVHYVQIRKRGRRAGWTDIPIPPPPQAPVATANPPQTFPDRNNFQMFVEYTGGELVRVEPGQKKPLTELIELMRNAFVLSFVPSKDARESRGRSLYLALSEKGARKHPTGVLLPQQSFVGW
jgi:hypothetical protein